MLLFLQFCRHALLAGAAEQFTLEIFPAHTLTVLLVQTNSTDSLPAFRAEHGEDGALTSWHSGGILLIILGSARSKQLKRA